MLEWLTKLDAFSLCILLIFGSAAIVKSLERLGVIKDD